MNRLVWDSDIGPVDGDGKGERRPDGDGIVRVRRETSGRKGKEVTSISGVLLPQKELKALAKDLKKLCGSGGSTKDGIIEIQGDHVEKVIEALTKRSFTVKRSGG